MDQQQRSESGIAPAPEIGDVSPRSGLARPWTTRPIDPLTSDPIWQLWRDLTARFPLWRSAMWWFSPSPARMRENSYFWFDLITGLRSMGSSQAVVARLATVSDAELAAVIRLTEINGKRQEHFFRSVVLATSPCR